MVRVVSVQRYSTSATDRRQRFNIMRDGHGTSPTVSKCLRRVTDDEKCVWWVHCQHTQLRCQLSTSVIDTGRPQSEVQKGSRNGVSFQYQEHYFSFLLSGPRLLGYWWEKFSISKPAVFEKMGLKVEFQISLFGSDLLRHKCLQISKCSST